ncbi:hypothetical protein BC628DRAFT_1146280 [Trametes gibbosa]|nr:hypothetical protein BC628DRAFT_1146280 [Trametes gibbosa]
MSRLALLMLSATQPISALRTHLYVIAMHTQIIFSCYAHHRPQSPHALSCYYPVRYSRPGTPHLAAASARRNAPDVSSVTHPRFLHTCPRVVYLALTLYEYPAVEVQYTHAQLVMFANSFRPPGVLMSVL